MALRHRLASRYDVLIDRVIESALNDPDSLEMHKRHLDEFMVVVIRYMDDMDKLVNKFSGRNKNVKG